MEKIEYPHDTSWTIERDEPEGFSQDVLVEYAVEERGSAPSGMSGPPENYDPGSGWVFCINPEAFISDTETLTLTETEMDAIHSWLEENHEEDDGYWGDY
jgi:hypothetical protein